MIESAVQRQVGRLGLYLVLAAGAAVVALPFCWMVATSLMSLGETINRQWLPNVPRWQNYETAWTEARFAVYFLNSVIITVTSLAGLLTTSILAAYAFARLQFAGREVIFFGLLSTMMIPEAMTLLPSFLVIRGDVIPLPGGSWLNTLQGLTVPFMASAFSIFLLRQFFRRLPVELWDAACMDGCGHLRFLTTIVLAAQQGAAAHGVAVRLHRLVGFPAVAAARHHARNLAPAHGGPVVAGHRSGRRNPSVHGRRYHYPAAHPGPLFPGAATIHRGHHDLGTQGLIGF